MRRIVEAAGGILYRWKDDAEPTQASSPSTKSNIATDGTIIANTTDSDGETTAAPGASDAASTLTWRRPTAQPRRTTYSTASNCASCIARNTTTGAGRKARST